MDGRNDVNPNPMYLQSTMEPNANLGPTRDPNPMYSHKAIDPSPMDANNDDNPNPMYPQPPVEPPNPSLQSIVKSKENENISLTQTPADAVTLSPANNDDNHCLQPYDLTHLEDEEVDSISSIGSDDEDIQPYAAAYMCQGNMSVNTASVDTRAELSLHNQPTTASNNTNNTFGSPSSIDIRNALNPNPMYVPNVQHRSACVTDTAQREAENGDKALKKVTIGGIGGAYGVAVSSDNEIFVPGISGICLDTLGRIIMANAKDGRIDMFTSLGKFVRTVAHIANPRGVAMGPCGDLVIVTSSTAALGSLQKKLGLLRLSGME
ncbi:hypothetical protein Bbelb_365390 [Branchiostoma belcheri]|nr:hypothetical protein Bbelb_365390 [Branchiostoma belcheri]